MGKPTRKQLLNRLTRAKEALHKEKLNHHRIIGTTGWGAGMRRVKIGPSFSRSNELEARIKLYERQLAEFDKEN